jgi:hypothetical protein
MRPRDYGFQAFDIYKASGKESAIEYIRANCPPEWRKLAYQHLKNFARIGLYEYS